MSKSAEPHPESYCHSCLSPNPQWTADNELFNAVNGSPYGIMCPNCFMKMANEKGIEVIFKPYASQPEGKEDIQCKCSEEDKHGETSIMCCNECGLPTEKFWQRGPSKQQPAEKDLMQDPFIKKHLNRINLIMGSVKAKRLFVECYPTDIGATHFPNSNFAVKEIFLPDIPPSKEQPAGVEQAAEADFIEYMRSARNAFVDTIEGYFPHEQKPQDPTLKKTWTQTRVAAEDILICFDQMRERLLAGASWDAVELKKENEKLKEALADMLDEYEGVSKLLCEAHGVTWEKALAQGLPDYEKAKKLL